MKINKRLSGILLIVAAMIMLLPLHVFAALHVDLDRACHLTVLYQDGDMPLSGARFSLYQVAARNENGEPAITQAFSRYNMNINKNDVDWKTLAATLEGYALRDHITPVCGGTINSQGMLAFPEDGKVLLPGVYLLVGARHTQNGRYYDAKPTIVLFPSQDNASNDLLYDLTVHPKHDSHEIKDEKVSRKVLKVWNDEGLENERPKGIFVQLLRDGAVADTKYLSPENNWRYVWENLDDAYVWQVVEDDPGEYEVEIDREGITFVITNTRENPSETTTEATTEPTPPPEPTNPEQPELPLTGQLWWPVPLLIAAGLVFIVIGLLRRRGTENEK